MRSQGSGILSTIQLVFLILKLTGSIDWSWRTVLMPTWIPIAVIISILILALMVYVLQKFSREFFVYTLKVKDKMEDRGFTI